MVNMKNENPISYLKNILQKVLTDFNLSLGADEIIIEHSKDDKHGDYATNIAMKYCKKIGTNPFSFAEQIISRLPNDVIEKAEIAGPGFINFFMKNDSLTNIVQKIISEKENYGRGLKKKEKINVEFVSANPTGDLHIGHARGAAIGDSICRLLSFSGYDVTREYYINDAGAQVTNLRDSIIARYRQILGLPFELPTDGYYGEDIVKMAKFLYENDGEKLLDRDDYLTYFQKRGIELELNKIIDVLHEFGVKFDVFSSEKVIRSDNAVEKELEHLKPYLYHDGQALVLKTSEFLDDKDRVVVKSDGSYTYFLPDIVYHLNKLSRGYDKLIDVLGADHHGYINRMKSALMMHGYSDDILEVTLIQMVRFIKDGVEVKASKRTGNAITLDELIEEVGCDASRYFFVMRSSSMHLDFDLDLAKEQSSNNPVYYAQYAHARLCSVLQQARDITIDPSGCRLAKKEELSLLKVLVDFPKEVEDAANERAPYKMCNYIHSLAESIHRFYTECRIFDQHNLDVTSSRLALSLAAKIVLKNALELVGVDAKEKM